MIEFTRESLLIFGFPIYYYGIILMFAVAVSAFLASREAKRKEMDTEFLWDSLIWVVIGGIIGARLWHIITPPPSMIEQGITFKYYLTHPLDALNIRLGGLGIAGAVIGGFIAFYIFARRKGQNFTQWVDVAAPVIPLGQAIGRWGNFINQELYGAPSGLPWAIYIDPQHRLPGFSEFAYFHPIFLYESLWNVASVFFLLWISRRYSEKLFPGDVFLLYLITYPTIRILLDFIRLDASEIAGLNANQVFMAIVLMSGSFVVILRHWARKEKRNKNI